MKKHSYAIWKSFFLNVEPAIKIEELSSRIRDELDVRGTYQISRLIKKDISNCNEEVHTELEDGEGGINLDPNASTTIAMSGIRHNDVLVVEIGNRGRTRKAKQNHTEKMRAREAIAKAIVDAEQKAAAKKDKTKTNQTKFKGKGIQLNSGKKYGRSLSKSAHKKKASVKKFVGKGKTVGDDATTDELIKYEGRPMEIDVPLDYMGNEVAREHVEEVLADEEERMVHNMESDQLRDFFSQINSGFYDSVFKCELIMRELNDNIRHILECIKHGDYAITEVVGGDTHILGNGSTGDDRRLAFYTVEYQSRSSELFTKKKSARGAELCPNQKLMQEELAQIHELDVQEGELAEHQPEYWIDQSPFHFWSVVLIANKEKGHDCSVIGKSLAAKFGDMLKIVCPVKDWTHIEHGYEDRKRQIFDSEKCQDYKKVEEEYGDIDKYIG